jgi:hypothetical protein
VVPEDRKVVLPFAPARSFFAILSVRPGCGNFFPLSRPDFQLDIVEDIRLRLQSRLEATREVRDTVDLKKAEPFGELGQSRLCVAAAEPGCDRPRRVRVMTRSQ